MDGGDPVPEPFQRHRRRSQRTAPPHDGVRQADDPARGRSAWTTTCIPWNDPPGSPGSAVPSSGPRLMAGAGSERASATAASDDERALADRCCVLDDRGVLCGSRRAATRPVRPISRRRRSARRAAPRAQAGRAPVGSRRTGPPSWTRRWTHCRSLGTALVLCSTYCWSRARTPPSASCCSPTAGRPWDSWL